MREIKFRAWVTDGKDYSEMYPNVQNHIGADFGFGHMLQNTVNGLDCKVMQYTGLKDKNGVEIYEGDIVKSLGVSDYCFGVRPVEYIDSSFTIKGYGLCERLVEVIGNIYENPELLGKNK
jgi:uncharacterized phage protein (TIGR01671 family)